MTTSPYLSGARPVNARGPATGQAPKWNFHKYLVGRDGKVLADFPSKTTPDDPAVVAAIEDALAAGR